MDESREEDRSAVLLTQDKGRQFRREAEQEYCRAREKKCRRKAGDHSVKFRFRNFAKFFISCFEKFS